MDTLLLVVLIAVAALFCPLMMWWQGKRGRSTCCTPNKSPDELEQLRQRQRQLDDRIAQLSAQSTDKRLGNPEHS